MHLPCKNFIKKHKDCKSKFTMDDDFRAQYYDWSDATSRTFNLAAINFTDIFER
jgi:hypothetical protein